MSSQIYYLDTSALIKRYMVQVPPELHRRLALEAAEAGVSLNRLASARLSH
jgi:predicted HicB family RNase H-like nuclease